MRLRRVFLESDLRCGFEGLRKVAKEAGTDLADSTVVFINRSMTSFKLMQNDAYLVYYKNGNRRIPLESLIHLPQSFGGSELEVTAAIRKSLENNLTKRK